MKITIIGTGYVGLVSGTCLAEIGHEVTCIDCNADKIKALQNAQIPIYEPGLEQLVIKLHQAGTLHFSTELAPALKNSDMVILAVGTPTDETSGRADLRYLYQAVDDIAAQLTHDIAVVTKSTVPVGTGSYIEKRLTEKCPDFNCHVISNPEFLREGSAVYDFMNADRIVVGASSEEAHTIMQTLYQPMANQNIVIFHTDIATAEMIKYASNAFLATKIAFANEMSDICEGAGANVMDLIQGMGMDKRIGIGHMQPGPGFGGSCFPKDTLALQHIANDAGAPSQLVAATIKANDARKIAMAQKAIDACGGGVTGKNITVLGVTFKANTDDIRYSPSLIIIEKLLEEGASIRCYDPMGMEEAAEEFSSDKLSWCNSSLEAARDADLIIIATEWDEFHQMDMAALKKTVSTATILDLRHILPRETAEAAGFRYLCLGAK